MNPLDLSSPLPLYHQLAGRLRRQMEKEGWLPGKPLPSEAELGRMYAVARPTVRQALESLVREGRLVKRRGLGTFVAPHAPPVGLFSLSGATEAFGRYKMNLSTRVLRREIRNGSPLAPEERPPRSWLFLERLRKVNGKPSLFERTWILEECVPGLVELDLNERSLYRVLQERYGLRIAGGTQRFFAAIADGSVSRVLRCPRRIPLLRVVRLLNFPRHPGAYRVEVFVREGPFVLEERVLSPGVEDELALGAAGYGA